MVLRPRTLLIIGGIALYFYRWKEITRFFSSIRITNTQLIIGACVLVFLIAVRLLWVRRRFFIRRAKPRLNITSANLRPDEFEDLTALIFARKFDKTARVMGGAGDGGIDVELRDKSGALWGIVQCKRYQPDKSLSPMYLRDLDSCKRRLKVDRAWLVTTASFSEAVQKSAREWGILLVDGIEFERLRVDYLIETQSHKPLLVFWKQKRG